MFIIIHDIIIIGDMMENLFDRVIQLAQNYDKVILMGHHHPDMDSYGSCLGLSCIFDTLNIENYIFLDTNDEENIKSIKPAIQLITNKEYLNKDNYKNIITDNTLLIICDTHLKERLEYPQILDSVKNVIVLDHHIKMSNYIKDTELFYIDSSLSCVVELIGYFAKYMKVDIPSIVATIMLAGMEIDTNGFNIKITEKAFICAGYLISEGADPILKQQLLQEEKTNFLRRADFIKSSYIYKKKYAICLLASTKTTQMELAEVSDELLKFEGVVASFTIGQLEKKIIGISARSLGNVDVCDLMKQLGGGGHATDAATQVNNTTIKALEARLKRIIDKE